MLAQLSLTNSLTSGSSTIFGYLNEALPIACALGFSILGVMLAFRFFKAFIHDEDHSDITYQEAFDMAIEHDALEAIKDDSWDEISCTEDLETWLSYYPDEKSEEEIADKMEELSY